MSKSRSSFPKHPLTFLLDDLKKHELSFHNITIGPLELPYITSMVADSFYCNKRKAGPLAKLVYKKTLGNPFFVRQFLKTLYEEKELLFNTSSGKWVWSIKNIQAKDVTDNVVDLVTKKIKTLSSDIQFFLKIATCVGNSFSLNLILQIEKKAFDKIIKGFLGAIDESLIVPLTSQYKHLKQIDWQDKKLALTTVILAKFSHDRIQQAAYTTLSPKEVENYHFKIGGFLLKTTRASELENHIFDIVNHLNKASKLSKTISPTKLAELNLQAGRKAKASAAYGPALHYFSVGASYIKKQGWQENYELTFALFLEKAESEYLNHHFEKAERLFDFTLKKCKSNLDKATVYNIRLVLFLNQNKNKEAYTVGKKALALLNVNLRQRPNKPLDLLDYIKTRILLYKKDISNLENFPETQNEKTKIIISLLMNLIAPSYYLNLFPTVILKMVYISLKKGNAAASSYSYMTYGCMLGPVFGNYREGYEFGKLALALHQKIHDSSLASKLYFTFGSFINHWTKPLHTGLPYLEKSFKAGIEYGDFVYAGYAANYIIRANYFQGVALNHVLSETNKYLEVIAESKDEDCYDSTIMFEKVVLYYQKTDSNYSTFSNEQFNEETHLKRISARSNKSTLHSYYIFKLQALYLFEQYKDALTIEQEAEKNIKVLLGLIQSTEFYFYYALTLCALYYQQPKKEKKRFLKKIKSIQKKMKTWAENCPENFEHKYLLIEAEKARILNDRITAMHSYEEAIASAKANGFIHMEALANELAGKYFLSKENDWAVNQCLHQARDLYLAWGATAKAKHIEDGYPTYFLEVHAQQASGSAASVYSADIATLVDTKAIFKALQTINSEIVLKNLFKTIMKIVVEVAGAERGIILLKKNRALQAEATFVVKDHDRLAKCIKSVPYEKYKEIPKLLVDNVVNSSELVVIENQAQLKIFENDPYIMKFQPKSILCIPIIKQKELVGILYLENNLIENAFTKERVATLKLLSAQMAISLENATLYEDLRLLNENLELRVKEEVAERKKAMGVAEKMAYQASLATLNAGITHEINNPIGIIRNDVYIFKTLFPDSNSKITTDAFHTIVKGSSLSSDDIWNDLNQRGYIDDDGNISKTFRPHQKNYNTEIDSAFDDYKEKILNILHWKFLKYRVTNGAKKIENNILRTKRITETMLKHGRAESAAKEMVCIHAVLDELEVMYKGTCKKMKTTLIMDLSEDKFPVMGEPIRLNQVFLNLAKNAVQAMEINPTNKERVLKFTTSKQTFINKDGKKMPGVEIIVSDTGRGIPKENINKIFDPFFTQGKQRSEGANTGLGLAIILKIIDDHNGMIYVNSEVGIGTNFKVYFPLITK
jgi:predicted ATPase/signal transduction histidine kinase